MKLSIVIPCYASEKFLKNTYEQIEDAMNVAGYDYELILVNDSSPDNTYSVIKELAEAHNNIIGVNLAKNFGQHGAIMAGLAQTTGELILCMDDDGQTPASEIHKLIEGISDEVDVCYASYEHKQHSNFRNLGTRMNNWMATTMIGKPKDLFISSFFVAKRYVIEEMLRYNNAFPYIHGLLLRTTNKIINVPVDHKMREVGNSGYSLKKLLGLWLNGFTAFSVKPLRVADIIGVLTALAGFIYAIVIAVRRFVIGDCGSVGWASMTCILLFVGGMQMLLLGLVGEYIGRTYMCMNDSPQYVIKDMVGNKKDRME